MRFEMVTKTVFVFLALGALAACGPTNKDLKEDMGLIGDKITTMSELQSRDGSSRSKIALFHSTTRVIHQFDLTAGRHERTLFVRDPEQDHAVLLHEEGNYIIDVTKKHISIFDDVGQLQKDPIKFVGEPRSAAFRPKQGLLIVYDTLSSVGMVRLNSRGVVIDAWVGGPKLSRDVSLQAGDLLEDGRLILAMSDGTLALVDTSRSIQEKKWVFTPLALSLGTIQWIAPVRGVSSQIIVMTSDKLALIDVDAGTVLNQRALASGETILKVSKRVDPHAILSDGVSLSVVYADGPQLRVSPLPIQNDTPRITSSILDLTADRWTYLTAGQRQKYDWKTQTSTDSDRRVKAFRFSDMLASDEKSVPDGTQVELTKKSYFVLYPSELGHAWDIDLDGDGKREFSLFNLDYIRK